MSCGSLVKSSPLPPTPTRHLSAKSAKSSPALTCTCRRCQKNRRSALALHYQTCSAVHVICPVIITSEKSRFNHGAKPMLDISEAGLDLGCHKVLTGLLPITACSESHSCFNPAWPAQLFFGQNLLSLPLSKYHDSTQIPKSTLHVKRSCVSQQCFIVQKVGIQAREFNR